MLRVRYDGHWVEEPDNLQVSPCDCGQEFLVDYFSDLGYVGICFECDYKTRYSHDLDLVIVEWVKRNT